MGILTTPGEDPSTNAPQGTGNLTSGPTAPHGVQRHSPRMIKLGINDTRPTARVRPGQCWQRVRRCRFVRRELT
jgi:hypothetical protein